MNSFSNQIKDRAPIFYIGFVFIVIQTVIDCLGISFYYSLMITVGIITILSYLFDVYLWRYCSKSNILLNIFSKTGILIIPDIQGDYIASMSSTGIKQENKNDEKNSKS